MFKRSFAAQILSIIAVLLLSTWNCIRVLDNSGIRNIQIVSLLGTGIAIGALIFIVILQLRKSKVVI